MNQNKVIILSGATATGKTSLSIELAKKFNCEIVNFDSLLFYKELNIGTAKPSVTEQNAVPHHLINIRSISEPLNAADYAKIANTVIDELHQKGKIPILVGGSGFYLQAVLKGMYPSTTTPPEILEKSQKLYQQSGINPFREILKENDKINFERLHENDHYRIRRAVEHYWTTGIAFSKASAEHDNQSIKPNWDFIHIYLKIEKQTHWQIIEQRTQQMLSEGLIKEVEDLLTQGFDSTDKPLQAIGYKQTLMYLNQEIKTQDELLERIYIATRRLAKSQKTWFNNVVDKDSFDPLMDKQKIIDRISQFLHS